MPWIYAESYNQEISQNVASSGGFVRNVTLWHDLQSLDGVDVRLVDGEKAPHVTLKVFQNTSDRVFGKAKIWAYGLLCATTENEAFSEALNIPTKVVSLISLATRIGLQANGDLRILQVTETEHGWVPYFEKDEMVGIDALVSPPEMEEDERSYTARRHIPYHQPIIGSITNKNNLSIYFTDVMRQHDKNTNVDVEHHHVDNNQLKNACEWLSINNETEGILLSSMPHYSAALSQRDPVLQFLLLWNCVEQIVNSVETTQLLTEQQITNMLDSENLSGHTRQRAQGSLKQLTEISYRDRVELAFKTIFGDCLPETGKIINQLRSKRSAIVHPRLVANRDISIITHLDSLRQVLEKHLNIIRSDIYKQSNETKT